MDDNKDNDLVQRLRTQAVTPFGPEGFDLLTEAANEIEHVASQSQTAQPTSLTESEISGLSNLADRIEEADEQPIAIARSAARAIDKLLAAHIAGTSQATKAQAEPSGKWTIRRLHDMGTVSDERGEMVAQTYFSTAKAFMEAHNASIVASVAKEATRDAETTDKANVLPPFAAPASQHDDRSAVQHRPTGISR